jgi:hypothetical protein
MSDTKNRGKLVNPINETESEGIDETFNFIFSSYFRNINTMKPGYIEKWDSSNPAVADVRIVFQAADIIDGEKQLRELPVIPNAAVWFPGGGGASMTFPLKKGDLVLVGFCDRSLDTWKETDGQTLTDPNDYRMHDISDAVVFAGMQTKQNNFTKAHAENVVIAFTEEAGPELHITPGGEVQIKADAVRLGALAANKALALAEKVNTNFNNFKSSYDTHLHTGNLGAPTTPPLVAMGSPENVSSTKVFTDG